MEKSNDTSPDVNFGSLKSMNQLHRTSCNRSVYEGSASAIQQYLESNDSWNPLVLEEPQRKRIRRIDAQLDMFNSFGIAPNVTSKPLSSIDGNSKRAFEENKEAQMNAFVPEDSTEQEIIAFLSRNPVDGENKPFNMWTGEERTAPLRGQRNGGRERTSSPRLPGHTPGSSLLGNANLMNGTAAQASTRSPIQGSPPQVVPQLRSRRINHSAGGGLQASSSINRHVSSSYLERAAAPVEIAAGSGISNNDTLYIPDRNSMFPPAEPGSSRNQWEDQNLEPVPTLDNTLRLAGGGRFSSESHGFAPPMISPTLSRSLFNQSTHLNIRAESQITTSIASSSRPAGLGDVGNPFWLDQNQAQESSALGTNHEWLSLQSYPNPKELLNGSTLSYVAQEPQDEQIFEYLDFRQCTQDEAGDSEEDRK
jgi:hypothetical protein